MSGMQTRGRLQSTSKVARLRKDNRVRESKWTQSVAVGNREFVEKVKETLGVQKVNVKGIRGSS